MSKSYKIKLNQGPGEAQLVDIPQVSGGSKPLAVKAVPGGKYQLVDATTGYGPENIRSSRVGQNLQVFFESRSQPDLVIEDYYAEAPEGFNGLIGESESGRFYEYIPETAAGNSAVPLLADGSNQVGMALGGAEINASGAAVGALVAVAGLNPLLMAPLALLGAGGGGGGNGPAGPLGPTGPTDSKGLDIVSMSIDSGVGSFSPLDPSRQDFKTNDNTPLLTGKLDTPLPPGEKIAIQLMKGTDVVEKGFATVDSTGKAWTWTPLNPLPDAAYTVKADVVDAAGNPALNGSVTKAVVIDTNGPTDGTDANSGLKTTTIGLSIDTAAKDATNADFVTSDGANKDGISNTEDDTLTFTGQLNKQFIQNGGKVLVKITDLAGHIVSSAYVEPQTESANTWSYKHLGPLIEGQYVVKAILVDHVGNMVSATDQAFLVDKTIAAWNPEGVTNTGSPTVHTVNYNNYSFSVNEYGTYQFNSGSVKTYTGGKLDFDAAGKTYESGSFKLDFWDQAGNLTSITNTDQKWIFGAADTPLSLGSTDPGYLGPKNFTGMDTLGSIGKLEIASNFDMASLYDGIASVADQAAANHIAMSNTTNVTLTLSMGDVLALGVTNSFSVDANSLHKGQIQMLVDGQSGDTLNLDGLVNGLNLTWIGGQASSNVPLTLGSEQYNVYTNAALGLALFVDTSITVNVL
jgi:hypothetical protein